METMENHGMDAEFNFESALEDYLSTDFGDLEEGTIVKGEIVRVDDDNVLVDVNFKSEGQIPTAEFRDAEGNLVVKVGDRVDVFVARKNEQEGTITLSFEKAKRMQLFDQLEDVQEKNGVIKGRIMRRIKGGYTVDLGGVEAFLPGSHVDLRPVPDMDALVNQEYEFRVLKINRRRSNVIVSRRVLLEEERDSKRQDLLQTLAEGQVVTGKAKNITEYGVFVDLGGLDGLLHITDMSWKRIRHPREMVTLGQDLELKVLSFDKDNQKVSLGLKQLVPDPWQDITARFPEASRHNGKVTNLVDYGAFVELEPGVEGLVHISELANRHVENPETVVKPGEEVFVKVIDVDLDRRRISLSLKQANDSVDPASEDFDPALYGMPAEYDEQGNYKYPEGFDPNTNEWIAGYEKQREEWESQYATAHDLWEQHKEFVAKELENAEASAAEDGQAPKEEKVEEVSSNYSSENTSAGTLADSDQLAALRDQLLGK